jgi:putative Holliday junction resolvase
MEQIKKYLGIDWGEKRIGLATADSEVGLALPLQTVANLAEVLTAVKEEEIDTIILGVPRKMSGEAANNPLWLNFLEQLKSHASQPVILVDERLTSQAADSLEGNAAEKAERDEIAATLILQDYLDRN